MDGDESGGAKRGALPPGRVQSPRGAASCLASAPGAAAARRHPRGAERTRVVVAVARSGCVLRVGRALPHQVARTR